MATGWALFDILSQRNYHLNSIRFLGNYHSHGASRILNHFKILMIKLTGAILQMFSSMTLHKLTSESHIRFQWEFDLSLIYTRWVLESSTQVFARMLKVLHPTPQSTTSVYSNGNYSSVYIPSFYYYSFTVVLLTNQFHSNLFHFTRQPTRKVSIMTESSQFYIPKSKYSIFILS